MSIVYYVGGSKDGKKGIMPYGLTKLQAKGEQGDEIYVERLLDLNGMGKIRVMALEGLHDEIIVEQLTRHRS